MQKTNFRFIFAHKTERMQPTERYFPAEWEQQSLIQLTWPHADTDWAYCLKEITSTFLDLSEAITRYERLLIAGPDTDSIRQQLQARLSPEAMLRVCFCQCPTDDTWARDHGALTLLSRDRRPEKSALLDFRFNGWGEKFPSRNDNAISRHIAKAGLFASPLEDHDDFVLEGGSVESDGKGTIFTTSQCLLAPHRNQPLTAIEIEAELKKRLCAERVVWLHHGTLIGDDTDGHIDTIVRCAPDDTLIYIKCTDTSDEQYDDFAALEKELHALRTSDGRPYRLIPLPMPKAMYEGDYRLPATYANFVVINGAVIVPTYGQPETDSLAARAIGSAFPQRDIICIDASTVVRQHGSLHCLTMQYY